MIEQSIATAASECRSPQDLENLSIALNSQLESTPDLIIASYSSLCDTKLIVGRLAELYPDCAIAGASTCRGAITSEGLKAFGEANITLWGLCDSDGAYGVGFSDFHSSVSVATEAAVEQALRDSGRQGELPSLIWMHTSPGNEESVVATIDEIFDGDVSIVGGSAADETLEEQWTCFAGQQYETNGVSLTLFFFQLRNFNQFSKWLPSYGNQRSGNTMRRSHCP